MGTYAASGGYLMALPGSRILANPATITGMVDLQQSLG
jgi:ClpP class serine protease